MRDREPIMIVVHPGSACGSADFNLGDDAPPARDALAREIFDWSGDIMVVHGALSDELDRYPVMGLAVQNAMEQAEARGRRVAKVTACDFTADDWPDRAGALFAEVWPGGANDVVITGAWVHDDGGGCISAVHRAIGPQRTVEISPRALSLP